MKRDMGSDEWKKGEARDTKLAQICLLDQSIPPLLPHLPIHSLRSTICIFHFPTPRRRLIRGASSFSIISFGPRKHYVSTFLVARPFASLFTFVVTGCTALGFQLGITRLQCRNCLRGSNDCGVHRTKWSLPPD